RRSDRYLDRYDLDDHAGSSSRGERLRHDPLRTMAKKKLDPAKAKAAKQKKIAIVGGILLILVLVIEVPMMMKRLQPSPAASTTPTTATATASADTTAAPTDGTATATATPSAASPTATASPASATTLKPDAAPSADPGQLSSFSKFEGKDPFKAQVTDDTAT